MATTVKRNTNSEGSVDFLQTTSSPRNAKGSLILATNPVIASKGGSSSKSWSTRSLGGNIGDLYYWKSVGTCVERNFPGLYADCYAKLRSKAFERAEAALAVDIAERNKTLQMVGSAVNRLISAARNVRRGRFAQAARDLKIQKPKNLKDFNKYFAENWLAYRYGWTPLYGSIAASLEVFDKPPRDHFVKATVSAQRSIQDSWVTAAITMKGRMVVESPTVARLNQMGLLNPLSVAWELVPFSFVADWFLPVGSYLESMTSFTGLRFEEASTTYHASGHRYLWYSNVSYSWIRDKQAAPFNARYDDPGASYWYRMKQRHVGTFQRPPLGGLNNGFNPKRLLDSIALLQAILLGKRK